MVSYAYLLTVPGIYLVNIMGDKLLLNLGAKFQR